MSEAFSESVVEDAALGLLESIDLRVAHGHGNARHMLAAERDTLLPNLISGDLLLKDTEKLIEMAA